MESKFIGYRDFVDQTRRAVFEDENNSSEKTKASDSMACGFARKRRGPR
jgi:hypothetical protein